MTNYRQERLASLLREEFRIIISGELDDPDLALVDVTDVVISKDLRHVKVYVNHQDEGVSEREILQRLQRAMPYLRGQLAERLNLRAVPDLFFYYDKTPERASRLDTIFKQIAQERQLRPPEQSSQ
jgi:ribosome-binding factor A